MDLEKIKKKLEKLNPSSQSTDKVDWDKVIWKPSIGKQHIRIVPSAVDPDDPFTELKFHYEVTPFPVLALSNYGKQDPIEEAVRLIRGQKEGDVDENRKLANKISPKTRVFVPVIIRGEEEKGVRLWGFGMSIYKTLLAYADDEEVGDFTDIVNGRDMTVEQIQTPGKQYPDTTVRPSFKRTPLSDNQKVIETWLSDQPIPMELWREPDYEWLESKLKTYLGVDEETEEEEEEVTEKTIKTSTKPATNSKLPWETEEEEEEYVEKSEPRVIAVKKPKSFQELFDKK